MELVQTRYRRCAQKCESSVEQETGARQTHPPGSQPEQAHGAVAQEMPGLADVVVENLPARIRDLAEDMLPYPAQRSAGVVRAQVRGRFEGDDANSYRNRPPGAKPVPGRSPLRGVSDFTRRDN